MNRFIVVWRKRPPESPLEWDQHFCMDMQEAASRVIYLLQWSGSRFHKAIRAILTKGDSDA